MNTDTAPAVATDDLTKPADAKEASWFSKAILAGIGRKAATGDAVYQGTVSRAVKQQRRAGNKAARRSRRVNRGQR